MLQLLQRPRQGILPSKAGASRPGSSDAAAVGQNSAAEPRGPAEDLVADVYAKFSSVRDPAPLWKEPVATLAALGVQVGSRAPDAPEPAGRSCVGCHRPGRAATGGVVPRPAPEAGRHAQVTQEGGSDAVVEAPAIYAALDSLAQRVGAWTERQHLGGLPLGAAPAEGVLTPEEAGAVAARAVKQARLLAPLCSSGSAEGQTHVPPCCRSTATRRAVASACLLRLGPPVSGPQNPPDCMPGTQEAGAAAALAMAARSKATSRPAAMVKSAAPAEEWPALRPRPISHVQEEAFKAEELPAPEPAGAATQNGGSPSRPALAGLLPSRTACLHTRSSGRRLTLPPRPWQPARLTLARSCRGGQRGGPLLLPGGRWAVGVPQQPGHAGAGAAARQPGRRPRAARRDHHGPGDRAAERGHAQALQAPVPHPPHRCACAPVPACAG